MIFWHKIFKTFYIGNDTTDFQEMFPKLLNLYTIFFTDEVISVRQRRPILNNLSNFAKEIFLRRLRFSTILSLCSEGCHGGIQL